MLFLSSFHFEKIFFSIVKNLEEQFQKTFGMSRDCRWAWSDEWPALRPLWMDPVDHWRVGSSLTRCTFGTVVSARARRGLRSPSPFGESSANSLGNPFFRLACRRGGVATAGCGAPRPPHLYPCWQSVVTAPLSAPPARIPGPFYENRQNFLGVEISLPLHTKGFAA